MQEPRKEITDEHRISQIFDLDRLNPITEKIIGRAYRVSNGLGSGFVEKVYETDFQQSVLIGVHLWFVFIGVYLWFIYCPSNQQ